MNPSLETQKALRDVIDRLSSAKRVVAFSGAGVSAESGIATFRGSGGLWGRYRIEEVATPEAFQADPKLVWDFYLERRREALKAKPNRAHQAIAEWERRIPFVGVVTQNIDNLHRAAGSTHIQELHGNLWKARCVRCNRVIPDEAMEAASLRPCELCDGLLRPHIVWFGEALDPRVMDASLTWMRGADLVFVVGTSGVVEPAASLVREAKRSGAFTVEVNPEATVLTAVAHLSLFGKSGEVLGEWLKF